MADPIGFVGSIVGIVAFGLKLGTTLQTWLELASEAEDWMRDIILDVNTTSSVLRQLQDIIHDDKLAAKQQNRPTILKPEGLGQIQSLAIQCEKTYKTIILLVYKASRQSSKKNISWEDIDPQLIGSLTIWYKLRWPWLEPRARRCREDLRWLKVSLLLQLQLVNLSRLHLEIAAEKLRQRRIVIAKSIARNREANETGKKSPSIAGSHLEPQGTSSTFPKDMPWPQSTFVDPKLEKIKEIKAGVLNDNISPTVGLSMLQNLPAVPANHLELPTNATATSEHNNLNLPDLHSNPPNPAQDQGKVNSDAAPSEAPASHSAADSSTSTQSKSLGNHRFSVITLLNRFRKPTRADFSSADLEAWIIAADSLDNCPSKLPYTHHHLQKSLKQLEKRNIPFPSMTPTQRAFIDKVTDIARKQSPHLRTCLGVQEQKEPGKPGNYIVYFSLGEPQLPIHFVDAIGRKFTFPYELIKSWEDMKRMIEQMFKNMTNYVNIERDVLDGRYDLELEPGGEIVLATLWDRNVKPGNKVKMKMWPSPAPYGPPMFRPGGMPVLPQPARMPPNRNPLPFVGARLRHPFPGYAGPQSGTAHIIDVEPTKAKTSDLREWFVGKNKITPEKNKITPEEEEDLTAVDFDEIKRNAEEGEDGIADMLRRFTNIADDKVDSSVAELMAAEKHSEESETSDSDTSSYAS